MGVEHVDNKKVIVNMVVRELDGTHNNVEKGINIKGAVVKRKGALKRCPLCGNEAVIVLYNGGYFVKCTFCECMVAKQISVVTETILPYDNEEDAVKKWNERQGDLPSSKWHCSSTDTAEMILQRREDRADAIAKMIRKGSGDMVYIPEIMEATGMGRSAVENNMRYTKKKYPQIKSVKGKRGYYWEESENE